MISARRVSFRAPLALLASASCCQFCVQGVDLRRQLLALGFHFGGHGPVALQGGIRFCTVLFPGFDLAAQGSDAFLVAEDVVFQHGNAAVRTADLLGDAADIPIQALDRNGQLLCLHPDLLSLLLGGLCLAVKALVVRLCRLVIPHLLAHGIAGPVHAVGPQGHFQRFALFAQFQEFLCLGALFFQRADPAFQLTQDVPQALQILARRSQTALGLGLAVAVFGNAAGLFKDLAPLAALGRHDLRDAPLPDDRIAVAADAGIQQQLVHVAQAAHLPVDGIFAIAGAVIFAADGHFVGVHVQRVAGVVQRQAHTGKAHGAAPPGAAKDHILHLARRTQLAGAGLAQHPAHCVRKVRLAGAVGAHHAGDTGVKGDLYLVGEALEALDLQFLEYHRFTFPLSRPAASGPLWRHAARRPSCCGPRPGPPGPS